MRVGLSGAVAMALVFIGAWAAALLPTGPTEMFVQMFTSSASNTSEALEEGILVAALIGFFGAAFVALAYKTIAFLERQ